VTSAFSLGIYVKLVAEKPYEIRPSLFTINKEPIELLFFCATHSNKSEAMREWEGHPWAVADPKGGLGRLQPPLIS
jgi:hypothetical protein